MGSTSRRGLIGALPIGLIIYNLAKVKKNFDGSADATWGPFWATLTAEAEETYGPQRTPTPDRDGAAATIRAIMRRYQRTPTPDR